MFMQGEIYRWLFDFLEFEVVTSFKYVLYVAFSTLVFRFWRKESFKFRDIATIVMQKTINPETQRPYTITMVERVMHEIHFAVDSNSNSKNQVCEMEPGLLRECDSLVRNLQGRLEILAVSVHAEGDTSMDHYDEHDDMALQTHKPLLPADETEPKHLTNTVNELSKKMQKKEIGTTGNIKQEGGEEKKGTKCSTCNTFVGEAKQYREHCKSDWHKYNLKRKTRKLPPLTAEECLYEIDMDDSKADLKDFSF